MGRWNESRASDAFQVVLSLEELGQWNGLTFDSEEALYYASAWAWVHYLVNRDEDRLQRLFNGLRGAKPLAQVMNEVFPPEEAKRLHEAVKEYLGAARFRGWETTLNRTPKIEAPIVLAPWEVHALRSQLYLRDVGAATREQVMAVSLAPVPLPPEAAVLKAELDGRKAKELLADFPTSPAVLVAAHGRFDEDVDVAKLEEALERPDADAELFLLGANTALFKKPSDPKRAKTWVDRATALAPWSVEIAVARVQIALALGDCEEARYSVGEAGGLLPERASKEEVERIQDLRARVEKCGVR